MSREYLQAVPMEQIVCPIIDCSNVAKNQEYEVNIFVQDLIQEFKAIENELRHTTIKIAPIVFNEKAWLYGLDGDIPVNVKDYNWEPISFSGSANIDSVVELLRSKFTVQKNGGWFNPLTANNPIVLFASDGNFDGGCDRTVGRGWFNYAKRIAVAFDKNYNNETLEKFINKGYVICLKDEKNDFDKLKKEIIERLCCEVVKADKLYIYLDSVFYVDSKYIQIREKVMNEDCFIASADDNQVYVICREDNQYYIDDSFSSEDLDELGNILSNRDNQIYIVFKSEIEIFVLWKSGGKSEINCHIIARRSPPIELSMSDTDDLF